MQPDAPIEHVSDTARWVAVYRAMETARPDAIFRDPYAGRLAGDRGRQIADSMPAANRLSWSMIVRTKVIDELVLEAVHARGADLVVNLAAGLDTRPWRLDVPASLRWVDVDLPGILDHKAQAMAGEKPKCAYQAVPLDLRDATRRRELFRSLGAERALVVSEGLLVYLDPGDVFALARELRETPGFQLWAFDLVGPFVLWMMRTLWGRGVARANAPFRFGPEDGTRFFAPLGWRELEFRSSVLEARRLRREMPLLWIWRALMRAVPPAAEPIRRMMGFALLERDEPVSERRAGAALK